VVVEETIVMMTVDEMIAKETPCDVMTVEEEEEETAAEVEVEIVDHPQTACQEIVGDVMTLRKNPTFIRWKKDEAEVEAEAAEEVEAVEESITTLVDMIKEAIMKMDMADTIKEATMMMAGVDTIKAMVGVEAEDAEEAEDVEEEELDEVLLKKVAMINNLLHQERKAMLEENLVAIPMLLPMLLDTLPPWYKHPIKDVVMAEAMVAVGDALVDEEEAAEVARMLSP
jgi:hypothetical protein